MMQCHPSYSIQEEFVNIFYRLYLIVMFPLLEKIPVWPDCLPVLTCSQIPNETITSKHAVPQFYPPYDAPQILHNVPRLFKTRMAQAAEVVAVQFSRDWPYLVRLNWTITWNATTVPAECCGVCVVLSVFSPILHVFVCPHRLSIHNIQLSWCTTLGNDINISDTIRTNRKSLFLVLT